jgi:uncharacterized protein (DUF433 family)/DNA-binding transcriptional MerR regulator
MSGGATVSVLDLGYYEAVRAAALSGVPKSTVYEWHRTGLVVPSGSRTKEMLWSYADLLKLRLIRWLRTEKPDVARTKMAEVREALDQLGDRLWDDHGDAPRPTVMVTRQGRIVLTDELPRTVSGQLLIHTFDLFAPEGMVDLRQPRRLLRIHPGRVSGEPHLVHSRLTTRAVAGLVRRGLSLELIAQLYPRDDPEGIAEAIDLEVGLGMLAAA